MSESRSLVPVKAPEKVAVDGRRSFSWGKTQFGRAIANQAKMDDAKIEEYLLVLYECGGIAAAANKIGVNSATIRELRSREPVFDEAIKEVLALRDDEALAAAYERGVRGWDWETLDRQGQKVTLRRFDSRLHEVILKLSNPTLQPSTKINNNQLNVTAPKIEIKYFSTKSPDESENSLNSDSPPPNLESITINQEEPSNG